MDRLVNDVVPYLVILALFDVPCRRLLLIHGLQDPVAVQQNSVKMVRAAIDRGVQVDYMIYPGHEHNLTGKDRAHLYQKVTDYLLQYVK